MTVSEYERRFRELSDFCPNLVVDEVIKKRRFLNGLSDPIALSLSGIKKRRFLDGLSVPIIPRISQ